jgi:RNA recognition motif-containing protein
LKEQLSDKMSRVYVGGIHAKTRERDLEKFFNKYGRLREILLKNGYGFVVSTALIFLELSLI